MELILKIVVCWLTLGVFVGITVWYLSTIAPRFFPDWWERHVVSDDPLEKRKIK